jgi:hypothetical protein
MQRLIRVVPMIAMSVFAAAVLLSASGTAASAASRPVVVYEPKPSFPPQFKSVVRPSSWYLTFGPSTQFRNTHWSSWGNSTATGTATMYVVDFGTHDEGHATLKLYGVKTHDGVRYYSELSVSGAQTEDGVWLWNFSASEWT